MNLAIVALPVAPLVPMGDLKAMLYATDHKYARRRHRQDWLARAEMNNMKRSQKSFPKNTLVMYEGGGYDGCFYELNYAYIDEDGGFHDIFSSGYKGCRTLEKLWEAYQAQSSKFTLYRLSSEADRFAKEAPITHLLAIARWFANNFENIVFEVRCDDCERTLNVLQCTGAGAKGDGGVGIVYRRIICQECACEEEACLTK